MLPDLIIAGVNKGGTTALFRYLAMHDNVCASAVKETCHFLPLRYGKPLRPLEDYKRHFSHCVDTHLRIESTPGYFYGGAPLAQAIHDSVPGVKIVIVLRDPKSRFFSFFHFMKAMQHLDKDLSASNYFEHCHKMSAHDLQIEANNAWFGLEGGNYADYLAPWIEIFGPRLRITFFENLTADPKAFLQDTATFAGINPKPFQNMEFTQENKTRGHTNAGLHALALRVYGAVAPRLNRHPSLKRTISMLYGKMNEAPINRDTQDEAHISTKLETYYSPATSNLLAMLNALPAEIVHGPLPSWLTETREP